MAFSYGGAGYVLGKIRRTIEESGPFRVGLSGGDGGYGPDPPGSQLPKQAAIMAVYVFTSVVPKDAPGRPGGGGRR